MDDYYYSVESARIEALGKQVKPYFVKDITKCVTIKLNPYEPVLDNSHTKVEDYKFMICGDALEMKVRDCEAQQRTNMKAPMSKKAKLALQRKKLYENTALIKAKEYVKEQNDPLKELIYPTDKLTLWEKIKEVILLIWKIST